MRWVLGLLAVLDVALFVQRVASHGWDSAATVTLVTVLPAVTIIVFTLGVERNATRLWLWRHRRHGTGPIRLCGPYGNHYHCECNATHPST